VGKDKSVIFYKRHLRHPVDKCYGRLNLLAHAQILELDVGSECGGHGVCGSDRVRPRPEDSAKLSPLTEEEREHLSSEEIAAGWRLACQCWPLADDLDIEVEYR